MKRNKVKQTDVILDDIEELACQILGIDYEEADITTEVIEEELYSVFKSDLESFAKIVSRLLPLIDIGESSLTFKKYKGFSNGQIFLVKTPYLNEK